MRGLMIAATNSGTGKTTISCGILRALRNRGYRIRPYKVGPDYVDTTYHKLAAGQSSKNLDEFILGREELRYLYGKDAQSSDISLVEGVMGLFDGYQADGDYSSSASVSKILGLPVILVMDCKGMAASAGAIAQGFVNYDKDVRIEGFILNHVGTENHFQILKKVIERDTKIPVLGRFPKDAEISLGSRHLGLIPQEEMESSEEKVQKMADLAEKYLDMEKLLRIAEQAEEIEAGERKIRSYKGLRLAVAMDKAFHFYYEDSLDLLREMEVELFYFSPLKDRRLPDCHGIYIGGGYPELFAEELESNEEIRKEIKRLSEGGMPIYAECGGLMYLGSSLISEQGSYEMVGIFEGLSRMTTGLKRFGYCTAVIGRDGVLGRAGTEIRGHEFHHSVFETKEETVYRIEKKKYDGSVDRWTGGYQRNNTLASYLHLHFCSDPEIACHFCRMMEAYRDGL